MFWIVARKVPKDKITSGPDNQGDGELRIDRVVSKDKQTQEVGRFIITICKLG